MEHSDEKDNRYNCYSSKQRKIAATGLGGAALRLAADYIRRFAVYIVYNRVQNTVVQKGTTAATKNTDKMAPASTEGPDSISESWKQKTFVVLSAGKCVSF